MPAASSESPARKKSSVRKASTSRSRSRDERKRKGRSRDRDRDRRRRKDDDSSRRDRRRQRVSSSSSSVFRRRRQPASPERKRSSERDRDRDKSRKKEKAASSEEVKKKDKKEGKESKDDKESRATSDEANGSRSSSKWGTIEANNPFPKGSQEALRLDAARLEVARLKALGKVPPPDLVAKVAAGATAAALQSGSAAVAATTTGTAAELKKAPPLRNARKAAPAPWEAARALFNKEADAKPLDPAMSSPSSSSRPPKDSTKAKKKLDLSDLSELSRSISEERNKLRLFALKAKAEFEERKENAKENNQTFKMGETDENEYYSASIGEVLGNDGEYRVEAAIGRGVFSSVWHCKGVKDSQNYALKLIRANKMMRRCAEKEVEMYRRLERGAKDDPEGCKHLIMLAGSQTFEHAGHLCMIFDLLKCDLRFALQKYGQGGGLPLPTMQQYLRQILLGLRALRTLKVVHADLKPDNILMTLNKAEVKICDFGSAADVSEQVKTSYNQPRYYRAPEIMLGVPYDMGIDMWSLGTTAYELTTAKILFTGKTNNQMLSKMITVVGKFPERMTTAGEFSKKHFKPNGDFISRDPDSITGLPDVIQLSKPTRTLLSLMQGELKHPNAGVEQAEHDKWVEQLSELIGNMIKTDPQDRIKPEEALLSPFLPTKRD